MNDAVPDPLTVSDLCDLLGRKAVSVRVQRGVTAVSNAATEGVFPSSWYLAIKAMCAERGIECPERLFNFVGQTADQPPTVSTPNEDAA